MILCALVIRFIRVSRVLWAQTIFAALRAAGKNANQDHPGALRPNVAA
jgi:hypothetical protein